MRCLRNTGRLRRQTEQRNGGYTVGNRHPEYPGTSASVLGVYLVHDNADGQI